MVVLPKQTHGDMGLELLSGAKRQRLHFSGLCQCRCEARHKESKAEVYQTCHFSRHLHDFLTAQNLSSVFLE